MWEQLGKDTRGECHKPGWRRQPGKSSLGLSSSGIAIVSVRLRRDSRGEGQSAEKCREETHKGRRIPEVTGPKFAIYSPCRSGGGGEEEAPPMVKEIRGIEWQKLQP